MPRAALAILVAVLLGGSLVAARLAADTPPSDGADRPAASDPGKRGGNRPLRRIKPPIRDWLVPFPPRRRRQMAAYSERHYGEREWRLRRVELIVEHMAATGSARAVHATFAANSPDVEFGELPGVCSHYLIGRNGRIYRLVPLAIRCRHTVGLNHVSIGIEHVGHTPVDVLRNPRQLRASLRLTRWLRCRFGLAAKRAIGHAESLHSPFYRELVPAFRNRTHGDWRHRYMRVYRQRLRRTPCP
jgi:N-acetylmuramoyl-L-alanine amidase